MNNLYYLDSETFILNNNKFLEDYPIQARRDKVKICMGILNKIAWWIPNKKLRDDFRKKNYDKLVSIYNKFKKRLYKIN